MMNVKNSAMLLVFLVGCGGAPAQTDPALASNEKEAPAETPAVTTEEPRDPLAAPVDVAEPPAEASQSLSGLFYKPLKEPAPDARRATPTSTVTAHYSGWTTDGELFDSSWKRNQPLTFPLTKVIAGWQEGVGSMAEGEVRRLWIPEDLAYKGKPGAPAGMLVFDVELIRVEEGK